MQGKDGKENRCEEKKKKELNLLQLLINCLSFLNDFNGIKVYSKKKIKNKK